MKKENGLKVVISGSFRKHLEGILKLKNELERKGIIVLKPDKINKIDNPERPEFVKFEGEESISPLDLEKQYIKAINECDAHIIYNKDSYLGDTASAELTYSKVVNKRIYLLEMPDSEKMISKNNISEEDKKQEIEEFYKYLQYAIKKGNIKVGIEQLYKDFHIGEHTVDEER